MRLLLLLARWYPAYTVEQLRELPMSQIAFMYDELTRDEPVEDGDD